MKEKKKNVVMVVLVVIAATNDKDCLFVVFVGIRVGGWKG